MANQINYLDGAEGLSVDRVTNISYSTANTYIFRDDSIAAPRVAIIQGGFFVSGPGTGYGQIFPTKQDR